MNGRSRLDRYQNLRSGMSEDKNRSENTMNGNYQNNSEYRSPFGNDFSNNSSKLYQNSDYDQLLKEHEDFLNSLDRQFGQINNSFNIPNNNNYSYNNNQYSDINYRQPDYSVNYPNNQYRNNDNMYGYPQYDNRQYSGYQNNIQTQNPDFNHMNNNYSYPINNQTTLNYDSPQPAENRIEKVVEPVKEVNNIMPKKVISPITKAEVNKVQQPVKEEKKVIEVKEIKPVVSTVKSFAKAVKPEVVKVEKAEIKAETPVKEIVPVKEIKSLNTIKKPVVTTVPKVQKVEIKPLEDKNQQIVNTVKVKEIKPINVKPVNEKNIIPSVTKVEKVAVKELNVVKENKEFKPAETEMPKTFVIPNINRDKIDISAEKEIKIPQIFSLEKEEVIEKVDIPDISIISSSNDKETFNPYSNTNDFNIEEKEESVVDEITNVLPEIFSLDSTDNSNEKTVDESEDIKDLEVFADNTIDLPETKEETNINETVEANVVNDISDTFNSLDTVDDISSFDLDDLSAPQDNQQTAEIFEPEQDKQPAAEVVEPENNFIEETVVEKLPEIISDINESVENIQQEQPIVASNDIVNNVDDIVVDDLSNSFDDVVEPQNEEKNNFDDVVVEDDQQVTYDTIQNIINQNDKKTEPDEDSIFAYISDALNLVEDYQKKPNEIVEEKKEEQPKAVQNFNAEQISDILNSWNFDDSSSKDEEIKETNDEVIIDDDTKNVETVKTDFKPKNDIEAPVYYDNPIDVDALTQKLEKERVLREQMLEQTKQINLQVKEYENELDSVNDSMSKTNKILNFVLTLLIMTLFVILFIIGFWFAQERGLL